MKDRMLVIFAVLFLIFSIGGGVNLSLEAGNRMMGRPMAPGLKEIYQTRFPVLLGQVQTMAEYGERKRQLIIGENYPALMLKVDRAKTRLTYNLRNKIELLTGKFYKTVNALKSKALNKRKRMLQ